LKIQIIFLDLITYVISVIYIYQNYFFFLLKLISFLCLNSIFFYNFLFFENKLNYLFFFKYTNIFSIFFFKKLLYKFNNIFIAYKLVICNNDINNVFSNSNISFKFKKYKKFFFFFSHIFLKNEYLKFINFFFLVFFHKINILILSFNDFFFEFTNFISYMYNPKILNMLKILNLYYKNKKNRNKFKELFNFICKGYKIKIILTLDFKYSIFFYKFIKKSKFILTGIQLLNRKFLTYDYSIYLLTNNSIYKILLFNQLVDIYCISLYHRNIFFCKKFLYFYRFF